MKVPPFRRFEVVAIILANVAVFIYQTKLDPLSEELFVMRWAAVPSFMWDAWHALREGAPVASALRAAEPLVTANYLHGSVEHIGMNMLFFWIFANVVVDAAGRAVFAVLYTLAGMVAVLVYVRTHPGSDVPMLGASGAIAGLEGAYFAFVFRWELPDVQVWPLAGPVHPARLAIVALINFALDSGAFFGRAGGNTAYAAHLGGFVGGAMLGLLVASVWTPGKRRRRGAAAR
jgi:membrane associated rhomboid family serine protease